MREKIIAFLLIASLALCCACSNGQTPSDDTTTVADTTVFDSPYPFPEVEPMTDGLRVSIEDAMYDYFPRLKHIEDLGTWASPINPLGNIRYYGIYGELVVLFIGTGANIVSQEKIADKVFGYGSSFLLLAYHDEKIIKLNDAYEQGLISAENIAKVEEIHLQFDMWQFPHLYD